MIADFALGLHALIWFAAAILPIFGAITGYKARRDRLLRASLLLACLTITLLTVQVTLGVIDMEGHAEALADMAAYRLWMLLAVAGAMALGWALHFGAAALRRGR